MAPSPTISPAPGEERWSALALVNTELESSGQRIDLLGDRAAVTAWLVELGLMDKVAAVSDVDVQRLRDLRAAVRGVLLTAGHDPPSAGALVALNAAGASAPGMRQLAWDGDRIVDRWRPADGREPVDVALAVLADDAMRLIVGEDGQRLRSCGAHGCIRLFVQEHARRRWCSRTCGDRVRVARHYEKTHAERGGTSR